MMDRKEFYGFSAIVLLFLTTVKAQSAFTQCYSWNNPAMVNVTCRPKTFIRITDIQYGITRLPSNTFCNSPFKDSVHCFERYQQSEMDVALACNMQFQCRKTMPFSSFDTICKPRGFTGEKYVVVTYECLSTERNSREIQIIDMTLDTENNIPQTWTNTELLYLKSTSYPQFTSLPINICQIKIKENTRLQLKILDLYGKNAALTVPQNCSYELLITNKIKSFTKCADQYFNINGVYEYITQNTPDIVQIAFQEKHTGGVPQAKLWLELATFTTTPEKWPKAGIDSLECDPKKLSVWTTTTVTSKTTISLRPSQSPKTTISTTTIKTKSTQQGSPSTPDSTTYKPAVDPNNGSGNGGQNGDPNVGKLENDSIMPIIAGVVAGGLVIIVIVIIIIVLMVRKHYVNNKPAKELDVIDAWDNQSVISAAQQSAKAYRAEQMEPYDMTHSLSISYPKKSGPSFVQQTSIDGDLYAEVPSLPGSKAPSEIGISNKGYENDSYYTGDVDGDLYYNSHKRNGHVSKDSRLSQMYSQPMKKKRQNSTQSGFDEPSWVGNGEVSSRYGVGNMADEQTEEVYGYTTTLN